MSWALLDSPLLGVNVPLHGQFDVRGASWPPKMQSPDERIEGPSKAWGRLPTLPTLSTPRTDVPNRNAQSCMETEVGGLGRRYLWKAWSFIYPEASVLPALGAGEL